MKILFACGGTGGHINPALAVAAYVKRQQPDVQILFAGNPNGMEARLIPQAGFDFAPIKVKGFQRRPSWHNLKNNVMAMVYLATSSHRSREILEEFQPDVVMGTGGYVSGPIVRKAARMGIKTLTHEQNAFPGVTTKLLSREVDRVLLAVEEAKNYLDPKKQYVVTGNPVREEILFADREAARKKFGISEGQMCILSTGGSLGADKINEAAADLMQWHTQKHPGQVFHIHATGSYGVELLPRLLKEREVEPKNCPNLDIREYINDMADCLAAADLVIGRSGAITLSELQAAGRGAILIPSPNVAENHQYHNAMVLVKREAALIIEEKELTKEKICQMAEDLFLHRDKLKQLGKNAARMAIVDANKRIYQEILDLQGKDR